MDQNSDAQELLKRILQGSAPPRPLFLPIVFSHAARIENLPLRTFLSNPTKITQALRQMRAHLRSDGLTCYFDPYLEIEALGGLVEWGPDEKPLVRWTRNPVNEQLRARVRGGEVATRGRIPVAVEVIRRLKAMLPGGCILTAGVSGPFALAAQLMQASRDAPGNSEMFADVLELASEAIAAVATAFLEAGAKAVFIREELPPYPAGFRDWASRLATTINIARFYQAIPVLLMSTGAQFSSLEVPQNLDCVVCPEWSEGLPRILQELPKPAPANLGIAIPASVIAESSLNFEKFAEEFRRLIPSLRPAVVTTAGDVPATADLRNLNKLRDLLIA